MCRYSIKYGNWVLYVKERSQEMIRRAGTKQSQETSDARQKHDFIQRVV